MKPLLLKFSCILPFQSMAYFVRAHIRLPARIASDNGGALTYRHRRKLVRLKSSNSTYKVQFLRGKQQEKK